MSPHNIQTHSHTHKTHTHTHTHIHTQTQTYMKGPIGLPFVGCLLSLGTNPTSFVLSLPKYSPYISSFYVGSKLLVMINDSKLLKKLTKGEQISHRPGYGEGNVT